MNIFIYVNMLFLLFPNVISVLDKVKFLDQHDISEYCRRQVVPSVFLGAHVLEADFKMIHFSKLDLPYSCFISVKTEFGYNIILVTELENGHDLIDSCKQGDQLVVFSTPKSIERYWKIKPESVNQNPITTGPVYYTMSTTQIKKEKADNSKTYDEEIIEQGGTVIVEVPLVNISAELIPDEKPLQIISDFHEKFDKYVDVTPRVGVSYETKIVPLVDISIAKTTANSNLRTAGQFRYQIEYNNEIFGIRSTTPLQYKTIENITKKTLNTFSTKLFSRKSTLTPTKRQQSSLTTPLAKVEKKEVEGDKSLNGIRDLMKSLNLTNYHVERITSTKSFRTQRRKQTKIRNNPTDFLPKNFVTDDQYLKPWNVHNVLNRARISRLKDFTSFSKYTHKIQSVKDVHRDLLEKIGLKTNLNKDKINIKTNTDPIITDKKITKSNSKITTTNNYFNKLNEIYNKLTKPKVYEESSQNPKGLFVSHESWDNIVQGAPDMVDRLSEKPNIHKLDANKEKKMRLSNTSNTSSLRKLRRKRVILPITLYDKPQTRTTECEEFEDEKYELLDKNHEIDVDLAKILEPRIDEEEISLISRAQSANQLRDQLRGDYSPLFNICKMGESKRRLVTLLNVSRIIISISNFTLNGMTLVFTSSKILNKVEEKCTDLQLECQVSGHRVCIDSNCACDGVPNCGSFNIYDEDRLRCKSSDDDTKIIPVIALVAIIFTLLYSIYFWLQRCVPNVSEAFFVYIVGTENVLYLDSVMKSPKDEDVSKQYHPNYFEEATRLNSYEHYNGNLCSRWWRFITCRRSDSRNYSVENKRSVYSFTQFELEKMATKEFVDATIQTGDSLEHTERIINIEQPTRRITEDNVKTLKTLKLMKVSTSSESFMSQLRAIKENKELNIEREMQSIHLNDQSIGTEQDNKDDVFINEIKGLRIRDSSELRVKKLRFKGVANANFNENDDFRPSLEDTNNNELDLQQATTSKDQRWFWNRDQSKNKKRPRKKPTTSSLPLRK